MEDVKSKVLGIITTYGSKLIGAIIALILGCLVIKLLNKAVRKALNKTKLDDAVKHILASVIKILLYAILIIGVVQILGVPMTSVVAILASCGLAVGLAMQGALSNLAGGLMILIFKPFKIGDYIESAGAEGIVKDISIFYTRLLTLDNKTVLIPNGDLLSSNVTNLTAEPIRRIDLDFKITNDIDQNFVKSVLFDAAEKCESTLLDPPPFARLTAVDDDTYIFTVRAWCNTETYWDSYFDLIETYSKALADHGIDDPEERIAVRLVSEEEEEDGE